MSYNLSSEHLLYDSSVKKSRASYTFISVILILLTSFIMLTASLTIYINTLSVSQNMPVSNTIETVVNTIMKGYGDNLILPTRYSVNESFILPPSDQKQRGTCWDFSSINLLESQYRNQGIKYGFLKENEYVNFSKQAFGAYLLQQCEKNNYQAKACKHGGLPLKSTDDHKADAIYYFLKSFPDLANSILPESVCPYQETESEENDKKCDGMDEAIKTNPISFKIKNISYARDVHGVKKLLFTAKRPLIVGAPLPGTNVYIPCDNNSPYKSECSANSVPCPSEYNLGNVTCTKLHFMSRLTDGTFFIGNDYNSTNKVGGHAMDIVGYNDDWVYASKYSGERVVGNLQGAFIVHNSWRNQGHSVEYLLGRLSEENEAVICPNHELSSNWISTTMKCLKEFKGDITKCGQNGPGTTKFVRGRGVQTHADNLKCVDERFCDPDKNYALMTKEYNYASEPHVEHLKYGNDRVKVLEWSGDASNIRVVDITAVPFAFLDKIFRVRNPVPNHEFMCGYYALPYQVVEIMNQKNWANLDNFHASDIEYEFENRSYIANQEEGYNYDLLNKSTFTYDKLVFDSPLPLQYIYGAKRKY